jgi:periplasmic copper chaperone A
MRKLALELLTATALTLGAILALTRAVLASDVMVIGAFARASAVSNATSGVVYMTLTNHGATPDKLVSITTPVAGIAMLHESKEDGGVATMMDMSGLDIPAGGSVEMKPGGIHIMLMGLKAPLKKGDTLKLTLSFEHAGNVEVEAKIGGVAQTSVGN